MELRMKFMTRFWEHWLRPMMLISLIRKYILKDNQSQDQISLDQQRSKEILEEKWILHIIFLRTKIFENGCKYKTYKNLFKKLRKRAYITHYLKLLYKYKTDSKRTWQVMKELTGKQKTIPNLLPREIKVDQKSTIHNYKKSTRHY